MVFPNSDSRFCVIMVFPNIFCTFDPRNCGLTGWWVNLSWIFCGVEPQNKCGWQQTKYGTYQNPNCYSFTKPIKPIFYWLQHDNMLQTNFCPSSLRSFPQGPSVAKQCKDQSVGITAGLLGCAERQQWRYIDYMDIYIYRYILGIFYVVEPTNLWEYQRNTIVEILHILFQVLRVTMFEIVALQWPVAASTHIGLEGET